MQYNIFTTFTIVIAGIVHAQDIDNNDVPTQCRSLCDPVVQLTQQCDSQNNDDDSGYINCVCNGQNASSIVPTCEACVAVYDESDNDVYDIVTSCSFTSATFTSGSTVLASGAPVTNSVGSTTTTLSSSSNSATTSTSSVSTTISTTITSDNTQITTTVPTEVAATTISQTSSGDNAAPVMTIAPLAGAGVLVLAAGLL
ncbi:hypothetical protein K431DRAFT_75389 [Polychaeton citri CBS 116435]|uniref:Extracellular membrane protein CFEM domain-containing protein n=1 Tax=Polychaeton citri CBS 116435 TaxID=1314669 RepID=A0A9P4Q858_9PEZI|nr:hypothetical protein K431DRAFT_75389 [Polychaeton citri CBS 116435]